MPKSSSHGPAKSFVKITHSFDVNGGARRDPAAVDVDVTGLTRSNTAGTGNIIRLVQKTGYDPKRFHLQYGVAPESKEIALYVCPANTPGAMPVRKYNNTLSFHLGNAFEDYPEVRPRARALFEISDVTQDADGQDCVIITLQAGFDRRTTTRSPGDTTTTARTKAAPAESVADKEELEMEDEKAGVSS